MSNTPAKNIRDAMRSLRTHAHNHHAARAARVLATMVDLAPGRPDDDTAAATAEALALLRTWERL